MNSDLREILASRVGPVNDCRAAGGGTYAASRVTFTDGTVAFCKTAGPNADVFVSEAAGLDAMAQAEGVAVPEVLDVYCGDAGSYLLLSWLDIHRHGDLRRLASGLAAIHRLTNDHFGWHTAGVLGSVPHPNPWAEDYGSFFCAARLEPHLEAARRGLSDKLIKQIESMRVPLEDALCDDNVPVLVHGDFWGGNHGFLADGTPVFYDPSPAYAIAAYDLGFARSFNSFGTAFFEAYADVSGSQVAEAQSAAALEAELIIMLAHVTMFGGGYAQRVSGIVAQLRQIL